MNRELSEILKRYEEIERALSDPLVMTDQVKFAALMKEHGQLSKVVSRVRTLEEVRRQKADVEIMLREESGEMKELIREELATLLRKEVEIVDEIREALAMDDETSRKDIIMEIRPGTGGEEAALFAADLFRMYMHYAEKRKWRVEVIDSQTTSLGGFKEVILSISGDDVYKWLRFESGGHRVQRVPETEAQGRIHTSLCTVAVLPEMGEVEVDIRPDDLKIEFFRAGGPGGQHVNKTSSAVRITHIPTGIVVSCQSERSQHKNRSMAMRILRSKLYDLFKGQKKAEISALRQQQIGSGDRSEKIRTYNFPQNRVTDHRIGLSLHYLDRIMDGELDELLTALIEHDRQQRLKEINFGLPRS